MKTATVLRDIMFIKRDEPLLGLKEILLFPQLTDDHHQIGSLSRADCN